MQGGGKGSGKGVGEDFLRLRETARNFALDHVITQSRTPMVEELLRVLNQERNIANRDALDANVVIFNLRNRVAALEDVTTFLNGVVHRMADANARATRHLEEARMLMRTRTGMHVEAHNLLVVAEEILNPVSEGESESDVEEVDEEVDGEPLA